MTAEPRPPARGLERLESAPGGFVYLCDCGTSTRVILDVVGGVIQDGYELAVTCDTCQSVHWLTFRTGNG